MVICQKQDANDLHMVQLMPVALRHLLRRYNPKRSTFLVLAHALLVCVPCPSSTFAHATLICTFLTNFVLEKSPFNEC